MMKLQRVQIGESVMAGKTDKLWYDDVDADADVDADVDVDADIDIDVDVDVDADVDADANVDVDVKRFIMPVYSYRGLISDECRIFYK